MSNFIKGFGKFYPCDICRSDLQKHIEEDPPDSHLKTNKDFNLWMCKLHNKVNVSTGKPQFNCENIFERWKESKNCNK